MRVALLLALITFFDTFIIGLVNPIYPKLVQSELLGATLFACILSAANAAGFLCSTLFGRLSDLRGRRTAIIASTATTCAGFFLYAIGLACEGRSPTARALLPALGRILGGVGRASLSAPLLALVSDNAAETASEASTKRSLARTFAVFGFGYASGSGVGGFVVGVGGPSLSMTLILPCAMLQVLCGILLPSAGRARRRHEAQKAAPTQGVGMLAATRLGVSSSSTRAILMLQALASASFHTYDGTSAIYMKDALGYSAEQRGYILSYAGWVFAAQTFFVVPRLIRLAQPARLLLLAFTATALGRFGLAAATWAPPTPLLLASYAVLNLGQGLNYTLLRALMSSAAGAETLGLMLGLLGSVDKLVGILGPLLGGYMYDALGPEAPACAAGLVALAGFASTLSLSSWLGETSDAPPIPTVPAAPATEPPMKERLRAHSTLRKVRSKAD